MQEKNTRQTLFLFGCIGVRSVLAFIAYKEYYKDLLTIITSVIGLGLWTIYIFKLRDQAIEAGGKVWWDHLRPIHGSIYLIFAYLNHIGNENAYVLLVIDVLIALFAYFNK